LHSKYGGKGEALFTKAEQIKILRDIMASSMAVAHKKVEETRAEPKPKRYASQTFTSLNRHREPERNEFEYRVRSHSPGRAIASLSLLKSTRKVQNALGNK
jgi:hypothetical protein